MDFPLRQRTKLIVGLDYGTTYSGISFARSNAADFRDIHPWTNFPGAASHISRHCEKAPSRIAYQSENPEELDQDAWGYQTEPGLRTYSWTKLLLDDSAVPSDYDVPNLSRGIGDTLMQLPAGKTAKEVVTDYLRGMYTMFYTAVEGQFGPEALRDIPMEVWLTVPATWSEKAKILTRDAAIAAGFASRSIDDIRLIPEPEAAAHMALKTSVIHVHDLVEEGSGVMVCDLGGGTVDITTYEIERLSPTLRLKELCVGSGGKCGGTFVDRNLYELLDIRFGRAFNSLPYTQIGPGSEFADEFEEKKKNFGAENVHKRPMKLSLRMEGLGGIPRLADYYDQAQFKVLLTKQDLQSLFDPVVRKILQLLTDQENRTRNENGKMIHTVVLVGGFGSSPYVKDKLKEWCENRKIRLTTPLDGAWSAIVRGAVLRGLEGSITTEKRCRRHYGHVLSQRYRPNEHKGYDMSKRHLWTDPFDGHTYLSGFMTWRIKKNDTLQKTSEIDSPFTMSCDWPLAKTYYHGLYACSLDQAPETIENDRIEKVGEVEYTIDHLDIKNDINVQRVSKNGQMKYKVPLTLRIRMSDEAGLLIFKIMYGGKEVGQAKLAFSNT